MSEHLSKDKGVLDPGMEITLDSGKAVDAVRGMKNIDRYNYNGNIVYSLKTTDGTEVYMTPDKGPTPKDPLVLSKMISAIDAGKTQISKNSAGLNFPMVDFRESGDIKGLIGAKLGENTITQAKYENAFKMDEKGATAEAAVAVAVTRSIGPGPDEIKGPMIVWFKKGGVITFGTRVGEDAMKKPA